MVCKSCVKFWLFGVILASVISWVASIFLGSWVGIAVGLGFSNALALFLFNDEKKRVGEQ